MEKASLQDSVPIEAAGRAGAAEDGREKPSLAGLGHLLVVYFVWGSTYLAIRLAVRDGAGFPPFYLGAMRVLAAGPLLLLWARMKSERIRPRPDEALVLFVSGILLWIGGNGAVMWAEQRADSGYAALLIGSLPIWVVVIEAIVDRRLPSRMLGFSLLVGFAGLGVLTVPVMAHGTRADLLSVVALLFAPISWGVGAVLLQRRPVALSPRASSGWQQLFGGAGFLLMAVIAGEPLPTPTPEAWAAWAYLVVFGSILAFTSFIYALRLLPASISMTYAYVNPVIAILLGWLILSEAITVWTVAGTVLIMLGVMGAFRSRYGRVKSRRGRASASSS